MHTAKWKILADPVNAGKHPLHDCRWIATADAEVEFSPYVEGEWTLSRGSLICQMRDISNQREVAYLIASAPDLKRVAVLAIQAVELWEDGNPCEKVIAQLGRDARAAIALATGKE